MNEHEAWQIKGDSPLRHEFKNQEHEEALKGLRYHSAIVVEERVFPPAVFAIAHDDKGHVADLTKYDPDDWHAVVNDIVDKLKAKFVAVVCEGWAVGVHSPEEQERVWNRIEELGGVDKLPMDDRYEVIYIQYQEAGWDYTYTDQAIIDRAGAIRKCREWQTGMPSTRKSWLQMPKADDKEL